MAWHRIDSRHLRQQHLGRVTVAFWDQGGLDAGHLLLHLDAERRVAEFELSYAPFLRARELFAAWQRDCELRVGEVDSGDGRRTAGPRMKASPIVRYYARPSAEVVTLLLAYVDANAAALAPDQYATVVGVLRASLTDSASQ